MSDRAKLYSAGPGDTAEMQRVLRICLCGMPPPAALSCSPAKFPAWAQREFLPVLAPHVLGVHRMALAGDANGVTAADAALRLPVASAIAGRGLLATRTGARPLPVLRRFAAAVGNGTATGHFATVMALHAVDFSVALLPLLQCVLYCEWRSSQLPDALKEPGEFFRHATSLLPFLASLLIPHAHDFAIPAARVL